MQTMSIAASSRAGCVLALFTGSLAAALAAPAHAQVASALLREGAPLPGAPAGHNVDSINSPAANHVGGFAFQVNSSDGVTTLSHTWGNAAGGAGNVLFSEGTYGPYTQTGFEFQIGLSDSGQSCYSPTLTPGSLDSCWLDSTPVAVSDTAHPTLPGVFWSFASRVSVTAGGVPYFGGGVSATAGGATSNRGLFMGIDGGTVVLLGGQTPPNFPRALTPGSSQPSFDCRMSANGTNYIGNVVMIAPTADDNAMILNGSGLLADGALVQEAHPIPAAVGGQVGETWVNFDYGGVNEAGDYFFTGDSNLAATADEFIYKNGQMLYRDGSSIDGETVQGDIETAFMNEDGDIAFIWDVAANTLEALFINDQLVLKEGDLVDLDGDGIVEANSVVAAFTGTAALAVSDRDAGGDVRIYFTADIDVNGTTSTTDDIEGGFEVVVSLGAPPCDADIVSDGNVNVNDLLAVITGWGACAPPCPPSCAADIFPAGPGDGDCQVNVNDLLLVITSWGPCP